LHGFGADWRILALTLARTEATITAASRNFNLRNAIRASGGEASFRAYLKRDVTLTTEIVDLLLTTVDANSTRLHYRACLHGSSAIARRLSVD
jgi:hypothetical protein